jgi:hypothetical protein
LFEVNQFVADRRAAFVEIQTHLASPGGTSKRGVSDPVAGELQHAEIRTFKEGTMVDQQLLLASLSQAESLPHWLAVVFSPRTSTNFTPVTRERSTRRRVPTRSLY